MTTARCPACGASVVDGAPWCTLCYADLRTPAPQPAAPPVPEPTAAAVLPQPAPAAATAAAPGTALDLLDRPLDAPVETSADAPRGPVGWPCSSCGSTVPLDDDRCPQCFTPFMSGADPVPAIDIPLLGTIRPLAASKSSRAWLMVGGALVLSLLLTGVLSLVGLLL
ncbi:MAG TPA: hypothetical protein VFJ98_04295 [Mycobacteriales bacterium]|nr:hypothetical protein [Mycobacteriales bacterium]